MADLYVIATIVGQDGKADALRDALVPAVEAFRKEDGCLGYALLEDRKRPGRFMTYERWRDDAALEAHMRSPTMLKLQPMMPELLAAELKLEMLDARLPL